MSDQTIFMPRKKAGYYIDDRVIEAIKAIAARTGQSANDIIEKLGFDYAKMMGELPPDAEPLKGNLSGGKRANSGRPKKSENDDRSSSEKGETDE
ncbi:MAG: hypothetical protein KME10_11765 [Plectolyngbya sp. WJT66-NPBG17]|nr:hypothetical protein [Plectolyngbya sp. WJT66-NPBG17]